MLLKAWNAFRQLSGPAPEIPLLELSSVAAQLETSEADVREIVKHLIKCRALSTLDNVDLAAIASNRRLTGDHVGFKVGKRFFFYRVLSTAEARRSLLASRLLLENELEQTKSQKVKKSFMVMRFGPKAGTKIQLPHAERWREKVSSLKSQIEEMDRTLAAIPSDDQQNEKRMASREVIPEHVRHEVWRRDCGQCTQCGSRERLEFDHVIPFSSGGSSTARNIQLLCEVCNRKKSDKI